MTKIALYLAALIMSLISVITGYGQSKTIAVDHFDKVIVSPHIQVTFVAGDNETVTIENARLPHEKINIEVEGKTLHIYLDGAKMITKTETVKQDGWKHKKSIYKGTQVTAKVTYKELAALSVRGEEVIQCVSPIHQEDFQLTSYGESKITMNVLKVSSLKVTMYGESHLDILEGAAENQKFTVYGEGQINTLGLNTNNTKITAYGESTFRIHVKDKLKVTAFGEATVAYNGNPSVHRGIIIGEATIHKIN